ncbi:MAG TPA: hypothetical protein VHE35_16755, partial [Kofleriaceae bacterium]|nr:hypothetical protein [Kofleriaceae bacterium]
DDPRSPTLDRILTVTRADDTQAKQVLRAWQAHEEGRRRLLAQAHPASIGEPVLDPAGLAELDRAFDGALAATLDAQQLARLSLEKPPAPAATEP